MDMKQFNIKWQEVEESTFTPLTPGEYAAKITESEIHTSVKTGNKSVKVTFTLLGKKGIKGRKVREYFSLTNNAGLGRLKKLLKVVGIEFDDFQDTSMLNGHQVGVELKIESSEQFGDQNKISKVFPFDDELLENDGIPF